MLESTEFLDLQWAEMLALRALKSEGWNHLKAIWTYHVGHASFLLLLLLLEEMVMHLSGLYWSTLQIDPPREEDLQPSHHTTLQC